MRKLKIDELEVTTFVTGEEGKSLGTVKAHGYTWDYSPCEDSQDYFCPSNAEYGGCVDQTGRPAQTCRASCVNYTCEGMTCGTLIC